MVYQIDGPQPAALLLFLPLCCALSLFIRCIDRPGNQITMSESKDIGYSANGSRNEHSPGHNEKGLNPERRRSSIADLNRNRNIDAKYEVLLLFVSVLALLSFGQDFK